MISKSDLHHSQFILISYDEQISYRSESSICWKLLCQLLIYETLKNPKVLSLSLSILYYFGGLLCVKLGEHLKINVMQDKVLHVWESPLEFADQSATWRKPFLEYEWVISRFLKLVYKRVRPGQVYHVLKDEWLWYLIQNGYLNDLISRYNELL